MAEHPQCDTEQWRPIIDYEGFYEVSDAGRVRSVPRLVKIRGDKTRPLPGRVLRQPVAPGGYLQVSLSACNQVRVRQVHLLVLTAFVGPRPTPKLQACHRNGNPADNRLSNLRWDTPLSNAADQRAHGTHHHRARKLCPLKHRLGAPNTSTHDLAHGWRRCLACERGRSRVSSAARRGVTLDYQAEADACYARIMAGETGRAKGRRMNPAAPPSTN